MKILFESRKYDSNKNILFELNKKILFLLKNSKPIKKFESNKKHRIQLIKLKLKISIRIIIFIQIRKFESNKKFFME